MARAGVGLDNVDVPAATARGVMVVNAPTSNIVSAAEHAVALLLAAARHIPAADASLRQGQWKRSSFTGIELNGKTVGIVGLGKIGQLVAQRLAAFGVQLDRLRPLRRPGPRRAARHRAARPSTSCSRRADVDLHPPAQDPGDARPDRQGPARAHQAGRDHRQRRPRRPDRRGRAGRGGAQRPRRRRRHRRVPHRADHRRARCSSCGRSSSPRTSARPPTRRRTARAPTSPARCSSRWPASSCRTRSTCRSAAWSARRSRPWLPLVQKLGTVLYALAGRLPSTVTVDVAGRAGR